MTWNGSISLPPRGPLTGPTAPAASLGMALDGGDLRLAPEATADGQIARMTRLEGRDLLIGQSGRWERPGADTSTDLIATALEFWRDRINGHLRAPLTCHRISDRPPAKGHRRHPPPGYPVKAVSHSAKDVRTLRQEQREWRIAHATTRLVEETPPEPPLAQIASSLQWIATPEPLDLDISRSPSGNLGVQISGLRMASTIAVVARENIASAQIDLTRRGAMSPATWRRARIASLMLCVARAAFSAGTGAGLHIEARAGKQILGRLALDRLDRELTLDLLSRAWPDQPRLAGARLLLNC